MGNKGVSISLAGGLVTLVTVTTIAIYQKDVLFPSARPAREKPNIILFLADDTGYADFHSYGHPTQEWGAVDRMAAEGMKFTQWTAADKVCAPSRASMLTGRYPVRTGVYGRRQVFHEDSSGGLPKSEITMAEALKDLGYSTGMVGKWHLGINEVNSSDGNHLPMHHGFDYVGHNLPLTQHYRCSQNSNDVEAMWRNCFLYNNDKIVEQPINLDAVTAKMVRDSKSYLNRNKDGPFFFYVSLLQTHESMFCNETFCGKSRRGPYGDNINEMAWAVGEILDEVQKLGIAENTLAIFISDNGASDFRCINEGSEGVFRGGKGSTWEGGLRVPGILWWPGTIPAGSTSFNFVNAMDLFPTLLHLAGDPDYISSHNITIDGQPIPELLEDTFYPSRDFYIYYCSDRIMAVRYNQYKIHYHTFGRGEANIVMPETSSLCNYHIPDLIVALDCYGEKVISWDPPLMFDIMVDAEERLQLNATTPEMQEILRKVNDLLAEHDKTMENVPSEVDKYFGPELIPCCNPPACTCNYRG